MCCRSGRPRPDRDSSIQAASVATGVFDAVLLTGGIMTVVPMKSYVVVQAARVPTGILLFRPRACGRNWYVVDNHIYFPDFVNSFSRLSKRVFESAMQFCNVFILNPIYKL